MTTQIIKSVCCTLVGVGLLSVSLASFDPVPQPQPTTFAAHAPATQAAPYAQATWVKLGDLVPTDADVDDVYVRLITIEGDVLLPVDHVR